MDRDMKEWIKPFQNTFDQGFFRSFHHLFENSKQQNPNLKVNFYEGENEMLCVVFLPGIKNVDSLSLKVHLNTIEISGNIDVHFENFSLTYKEFENGEFHRIIGLPYIVREDKVEATYKQGLLIIHLYKLMTRTENEHKISIHATEE